MSELKSSEVNNTDRSRHSDAGELAAEAHNLLRQENNLSQPSTNDKFTQSLLPGLELLHSHTDANSTKTPAENLQNVSDKISDSQRDFVQSVKKYFDEKSQDPSAQGYEIPKDSLCPGIVPHGKTNLL